MCMLGRGKREGGGVRERTRDGAGVCTVCLIVCCIHICAGDKKEEGEENKLKIKILKILMSKILTKKNFPKLNKKKSK